jgi:hypothetical protein
LHLPVAPRRQKQGRRFSSRQPALARWTLFRQYDRDHLRAQSFTSVMVDGGAEVLELAAHCRIRRSLRDIRPAQFAMRRCRHTLFPIMGRTALGIENSVRAHSVPRPAFGGGMLTLLRVRRAARRMHPVKTAGK